MTSIREHLIAFAQGSLSPSDALERALAAIERFNPSLNAVPIRVDPEHLRAQARALASAIGKDEPVGELAGISWVAKDTHRTAGLRTTFGSPIFADHVPAASDPIIERLGKAGCLLLGKSNTPEFAAGSQTFNTLFGATRNPHDPQRTAGGSTGGGACAVATGMALVADGSDLAASLRNPASFCGVVGHRRSSVGDPTLESGLNAFAALSVDGTLGGCVDDVRLSFRAYATPSAPMPLGRRAQALREETQRLGRGGAAAQPRPPGRLRLAYSVDAAQSMPVETPVRQAIEKAVSRLADAGVELIEASPDFAGADECFQVLRGLYFVENLGELYRTERQQMKDTVVWNIEFGLSLDAARIAAAQRMRTEIFQRVARFLEPLDGWLLPTAQVLPFSIDTPYPVAINGQPLGTYIDWLRSCYWVSVSGHPAVSIPCAMQPSAEGTALPVGLQVVGRFGQDEALFDVAETLESLLAPGLKKGTPHVV
jgi:amidase